MRAAAVATVMLFLLAPQALAAGRPVALTAADGTVLTGMFYEALLRPAPAVVLVHMLGRSKDEWVYLAERLQRAGISSLAIDLRGHGRSEGNGSDLVAMVGDVRTAVGWIAAQPGTGPDAVGIVGASLGANLAAVAAADSPMVKAIALLSPSLDYRGVRIDATVMKKIGARPVWLAASSEDPYALRTIKELAGETVTREQRVSTVRAHGTPLLYSDHDLSEALVDWLRRTLIF